MEITRLASTYRRSVAVSLPDGREAWIAHEATIEASYAPGEIEGGAIPQNVEALRQIAISEVAKAIKAESDALKAACTSVQVAVDEPFASQETAFAQMPKV